MNTTRAPRSISEYLQQVRAALRGEHPAIIREALAACEEHLRAELAANPDKTESELLAHITGTYGAPEDVAALYPLEPQLHAAAALRFPCCPCFPCQHASARWPHTRGGAAVWSGSRRAW